MEEGETKSLEQENIERLERLQRADKKEQGQVQKLHDLFGERGILEDAKTPRELEIPELSAIVRYTPLSYGERRDVMSIKGKTPEETLDLQNRRAFYFMVAKHYDVKMEDIDGFPADVIDAVLIAIGEKRNPFLSRIAQRVLSSLGQAPKPNA